MSEYLETQYLVRNQIRLRTGNTADRLLHVKNLSAAVITLPILFEKNGAENFLI